MKEARIIELRARRIWDSRGRPTLETQVELDDGSIGLGQAPAGASTGRHEAIELRDGEHDRDHGGFDVQHALKQCQSLLRPKLLGQVASDQQLIDQSLIDADEQKNKAMIGANTTIAVSIACAKAAALSRGLPLFAHLSEAMSEAEEQTSLDKQWQLPLPQIQIFGGGAHAGRRIDIQDLMVTCPAADSVAEALSWTARVYRAAGEVMRKRRASFGVADEGGWWPDFKRNEEALNCLIESIEIAGLRPGEQVWIALDIAATQWFSHGAYQLSLEGHELDAAAMIEMLGDWARRYPIASIEDPLAEDDSDGFIGFTKAFGDRLQIVGDDFLVTSAARITKAASMGAANAVLLKPNQRGTLSETLQAWLAAKAVGYQGIVSARSGETEDQSIVHLALAWQVPQLKVGSFSRGERMVKWNELLRLEDQLGERAFFVGAKAIPCIGRR
jgi:enolase